MWLLTENSNGTFTGVNYTTGLDAHNKLIRVVKSKKTGDLKTVAQWLVNFKDVLVSDIEQALEAMDQSGDDTACFGVLGSFMNTESSHPVITA